MKSWNGRSRLMRIEVSAMFIIISAVSNCDMQDPTDVSPREVQSPQKAQVPMRADSTGSSTEDNCYWIDGQWICNDVSAGRSAGLVPGASRER